MRWTRTADAAALVIGSIGLAGPAAAAPPNDDYQNATVLSGPLPITVEQSTLDADASPYTNAAELNAKCDEFTRSPATDASVWFKYTPSEAGTVRVDTDGSDYSVGVIAAEGGAGQLDRADLRRRSSPLLARGGGHDLHDPALRQPVGRALQRRSAEDAA